MQTLWGGYGELLRVALDGDSPSVIVKWIRPPTGAAGISDNRKRRSYEVELAFYRDFAPRCDAACRVARLHASRRDDGALLIVLEDLDASGFSARHHEARGPALDASLAWLAAFHARWLGDPGASLWPVGTYWHLGTRTGELAAITDGALRAAAGALDDRLARARFQTILHGDPKDANFCFTLDDQRAAAVDFQYAGRGTPMKDVAYLLYGRDDEPPDGIASDHLARYFHHLRGALAGRDVDADAIEREGRELYPVARLDFCRFLAGWSPSHWQRDHRGQRFVRAMLDRYG